MYHGYKEVWVTPFTNELLRVFRLNQSGSFISAHSHLLFPIKEALPFTTHLNSVK
ncbi:hypothetical protein J6590_091562, partial [Homalodisca vitripennis]